MFWRLPEDERRRWRTVVAWLALWLEGYAGSAGEGREAEHFLNEAGERAGLSQGEYQRIGEVLRLLRVLGSGAAEDEGSRA